MDCKNWSSTGRGATLAEGEFISAASLVGETPTAERSAAAGRIAAGEEVDPTGDLHASADFKRHLVGVLAGRALALAARRATEAAA